MLWLNPLQSNAHELSVVPGQPVHGFTLASLSTLPFHMRRVSRPDMRVLDEMLRYLCAP
jgi:hypothetical protein